MSEAVLQRSGEFGATIAQPFSCRECRQQEFFFSQVAVLGEYRDLLRRLILTMKTDRDGTLSCNAARLFLEQHHETLCQWNVDLVAPVPMHYVRRWYRGVNNPIFFAKEIEHQLNIPVSLKLLRRTRHTKPQFRLKPKQRYRNVHGAFAVACKTASIANKHILIVDDIMTTGATCNEIARILLEAGAAKVSVAVLSRAMGQFVGQERDIAKEYIDSVIKV